MAFCICTCTVASSLQSIVLGSTIFCNEAGTEVTLHEVTFLFFFVVVVVVVVVVFVFLVVVKNYCQ